MRRAMILVLALALVAAACGGSDPADDAEPASPSRTASDDVDESVADSGDETDDVEDETDDATTDDAKPSPGDAGLADGWSSRALGSGVKPVLSLDGDGQPAVAWLSEAIDDGFVSFADAANDWAEERIVEGYFYGPIGLDFDPEGLPHVVYHDHQADTFQDDLGDLAHAVRAGDAWAVEAATDDGHDGWDSVVAVSDDGIVRAAGIDPQQFGRQDGVEYYELGPDGWSVTAIGSGPVEYEWNVDLQVSDDGQVGLSYFDNNTADLVFASLVDGAWQLDIVDSEGDVGRFSSLAFDDGGTPHISYYVADGTVRYATRTADGWSTEDVGRLDAVEIAFSGARRITAIDLDASGAPNVVFGDLEVVRHATRGTGWTVTDVLTATDRPLGQLVSLAVGDGAVHIATYTGSADQPAAAEILYLTNG